ncbi:hypothetical protein ACXWRW_11475, partial [Streptococcus pyogenes]
LFSLSPLPFFLFLPFLLSFSPSFPSSLSLLPPPFFLFPFPPPLPFFSLLFFFLFSPLLLSPLSLFPLPSPSPFFLSPFS